MSIAFFDPSDIKMNQRLHDPSSFHPRSVAQHLVWPTIQTASQGAAVRYADGTLAAYQASNKKLPSALGTLRPSHEGKASFSLPLICGPANLIWHPHNLSPDANHRTSPIQRSAPCRDAGSAGTLCGLCYLGPSSMGCWCCYSTTGTTLLLVLRTMY